MSVESAFLPPGYILDKKCLPELEFYIRDKSFVE